ncbi:hypothetical protein IW138_001341 [Coemansia sp. RSA 986]|nr:hypothetical protein IW138_001341 [Coemansia sp. RSA 986]
MLSNEQPQEHMQRAAVRLYNELSDPADAQVNGLFESKEPVVIDTVDVATLNSTSLAGCRMKLLLRPCITTGLFSEISTYMKYPLPLSINSDKQLKVPGNTDDALPAVGRAVSHRSALYLTGCVRSGKSHILRELALRTVHGCPSTRVVYLGDCNEWLNSGTTPQQLLGYFWKAVLLAFAADMNDSSSSSSSSSSSTLWHALTLLKAEQRELSDLATLGQSLLKSLSRLCRCPRGQGLQPPNEEEEGGEEEEEDEEEEEIPEKAVCLLLCIDNYDALCNSSGLTPEKSGTAKMLRSIVEYAVACCSSIFVVLAARANFIPDDMSIYERTVTPWFSRPEALALMRNSSQQQPEFIHRRIERNCGEDIARILDTLVRCTSLNPGEMTDLLAATSGAFEYDDFVDQADAFVGSLTTTRLVGIVGLSQHHPKTRLSSRAVRQELIDYVEATRRELIFRILYCLHIGGNASCADRVDKIPELSHHQIIHTIGNSPNGGVRHVFVAPRFAAYFFNKELKSPKAAFRAMQSGLQGTAQGMHELAYATLMWVFSKDSLAALNNAGVRTRRRQVVLPNRDDALSAEIHQLLGVPFEAGIGCMAMHADANPPGGVSSSGGLDFVVATSGGENGLVHLVTAMVESNGEYAQIVSMLQEAANGDEAAQALVGGPGISYIARIVHGVNTAIDVTTNQKRYNGTRCIIYLPVRSTVYNASSRLELQVGGKNYSIEPLNINDNLPQAISYVVNF